MDFSKLSKEALMEIYGFVNLGYLVTACSLERGYLTLAQTFYKGFINFKYRGKYGVGYKMLICNQRDDVQSNRYYRVLYITK